MTDVFLHNGTETDVGINGNTDTNVETSIDLQTNITTEEDEKIYIEVENPPTIEVEVDGNEENTKDYEKLVNKPKINGVEVVGEKSSSDYGLQDEIAFCTNLDIDKLFK